MSKSRPAYLAGGLDAIPALMTEVRHRAELFKIALPHLAEPERCERCIAWFDLATARMCPVCHWFGSPGLTVILFGRLTTVEKARRERGITPEEMR